MVMWMLVSGKKIRTAPSLGRGERGSAMSDKESAMKTAPINVIGIVWGAPELSLVREESKRLGKPFGFAQGLSGNCLWLVAYGQLRYCVRRCSSRH